MGSINVYWVRACAATGQRYVVVSTAGRQVQGQVTQRQQRRTRFFRHPFGAQSASLGSIEDSNSLTICTLRSPRKTTCRTRESSPTNPNWRQISSLRIIETIPSSASNAMSLAPTGISFVEFDHGRISRLTFAATFRFLHPFPSPFQNLPTQLVPPLLHSC